MSGEFGEIMQFGYIVDDIEAAAADWVKHFGTGPFYSLDRISMDQYFYRGTQTPVELQLAFAYWGSIQIELIRPLCDADTLYARALRSSPGRLNHCATVVSDIDALLESRQLHSRVIQSGQMPTGLKFVYLDEYLPGGLHLELIEAQESTLAAFAGMEKLARNWDGRDPVRPMSRIQDDLAAVAWQL